MKTLKIKPIPTPSGADHPAPPNDVLPKHEFSMGFIAPKGSGKTTCLMNLLHFYKKYFHSIVIMSPTINNDEKWDWVKKQPLLGENKKLKEWIKMIKEKTDINQVVHKPNDTEDLPEPKEDHDPHIPEGCFLTEYSEELLKEIIAEQDKMVKTLKAHGKTKHLANRLLLIFDDLVGSELFSGGKRNPFKMLNTNHRHYSTSIIMVSQAYKEIPKTVRTQFSCLIAFDIPNDAEVKVIYEENSMKLKLDEWLELYRYAVHGDHDFIFFNYQQKDKNKRIMKNFDQYLFHKTEAKKQKI